LHGLYFQTHRGVQSLFESIIYDFQIDPILISIGIFGFVFAVIKKDFLILLWLFPFLSVLYFVGFVSYWHLLPLLPAFCIAGAHLLEDLPKRITTANKVKSIINKSHHHDHNHHQQLQNKLLSLLPFIVTTEIVFLGFLLTIYVLIINDNLIHFDAIAFVSQELNNNNNNNNKIVLISNPFYSWIPKYVFKLNNC
jgi:hypothetical protein